MSRRKHGEGSIYAYTYAGVRKYRIQGPYPRILDTGCDYAAVASVAARRAS